jgi:hypothetical protein
MLQQVGLGHKKAPQALKLQLVAQCSIKEF